MIHWLDWDKLTRPKLEGGMDFKDLHQFNLVMLAKEGWRLMQDQESLLFQCLKARYFLLSHFLKATDSPNSSYMWKSIMAAKSILQRGSCWRVGNGSHVRVLNDAWIPNHPTNRVLHPTPNKEEEITISELVDQDSRGWGREFIWQNFHCDDAEAILRVPLSYRVISNTVV